MYKDLTYFSFQSEAIHQFIRGRCRPSHCASEGCPGENRADGEERPNGGEGVLEKNV